MTLVEYDEHGKIIKLEKRGKVKMPNWQKKALKRTNEARRKLKGKKGEQTDKPELTAGRWEDGVFIPY